MSVGETQKGENKNKENKQNVAKHRRNINIFMFFSGNCDEKFMAIRKGLHAIRLILSNMSRR